MKFKLKKEALLKPLQATASAISRHSTLPILSNYLLNVHDDVLTVTATDLEVELISRAQLTGSHAGAVTVPALKLLNICRALPPDADVNIELEGKRLLIRSGKTRYNLMTLPADEYPAVKNISDGIKINTLQSSLKQLIAKTHFAIATNDVRYFLMGLLLELEHGVIRTCATDGHRLAVSEYNESAVQDATQVIIPRKGVAELMKVIKDTNEPIELIIGNNHIQAILPDVTLTSKLIDGKFPEYKRLIPMTASNNRLTASCAELREALSRAAVISTDKVRGVRLEITPMQLKVTLINTDKEQAEEEVEVNYAGENLDISFNVVYLLDALSVIDAEQVTLNLTSAESSILIYADDDSQSRYIVMPMRI
jgi:DNA polymerase-3 subunit beta